MVDTEIQLQRYESYKESGVEWLGVIPEHWQVKPGFTILSESREKNIGFIEKTVLSLSYGNVVVKPEEKLTGLVPESFETYQLVKPGDIIIRPTDLQNDKTSLRTGLAKDKGIITSAYINLRVKEDYSGSFYHYYLHTIDINKIIYGLGSGLRQNISFGDFKRFSFPYPPKKEQSAIAKFLDDKTTKIDAAVAIKEQQINLLKERKKILIHKAVTQGLNPNVKLKDSGVEWIGEIPEHWEVKKIKHLVIKTFSGGTPSTDKLSYWDGGIPWISSVDIKTDRLRKTSREISSLGLLNSSAKMAPKGALVFVTRSGILQHTFPLSILERDMAINQDIKCLLLSQAISSEYLQMILKGNNDRILVEVRQQAATVESIDMPAFFNLPIPVPNLQEQKEISAYIETASRKIETAIALKQKEIAKLKEYKGSLINSCVTGKVKVF